MGIYNIADFRKGTPANRASSYSVLGSSSTQFTPLDLGASLYAWWDADSINAGSVSTWLDRTGTKTLAQTESVRQPSKVDLIFTSSEGSFYPGVYFDSGDQLTTPDLGATLDPLSNVCVILSAQDSATAASIIMEYGVNAAAGAGRFWLVANEVGQPAESVEWQTRNVGNGTFSTGLDTAPLSRSVVITGYHDFSASSGQTLRRINGYDVSGSVVANASAAGTFENGTLNIGCRAVNFVAPWTGGRIRDLVFFSGTFEQIKQVETFVGNRVGVSVSGAV